MPQISIDQAIHMALAQHQAGRFAEAEDIYRQILQAVPRHPVALHLLGVVNGQTGRLPEAVGLIQRALEILPNEPFYLGNLGKFLLDMGRNGEALAAYEKALAIHPGFAGAHVNIGNAYMALGRRADAIAAYRRAAERDPALADAHHNLGRALRENGQVDEAIAASRRALALVPSHGPAHMNLGLCFSAAGLAQEAVAALREAVRLDPAGAHTHSALLYTLHLDPRSTPESLLAEHRAWNQRHARAAPPAPHTNDRSPDRPLRIAYLSADFRQHAAGRFMQPLLAAHDPGAVEVFCYSGVDLPDDMTARLRALAPHWQDTFALTDDALAAQIHADQIDILVDLAAHTAGNRLTLFARKPAPIQVTYLAYCSTTGVDAIDYRLTDPHLDPPDADQNYTERSVRLETYWCYGQPDASGPLSDLPALRNGFVTFGSLNNFAKISGPVLETWAELLLAVPESHLLLHAPTGTPRERVTAIFLARKIDVARVAFTEQVSTADYFKCYDQIDVALDSFPYAGGTTTCDACWMGVPVVTLAGKTAVGRGGVSILSQIGHPEWIAHTPAEYVKIAAQLAGDLPQLARIRHGLRGEMNASPLMDAGRFASAIECAYRQMWKQWCAAG